MVAFLNRHFGRAQGRGDEDTVAGGEGAEAVEEESMGAVAGSTDYGAEAVLSLVIWRLGDGRLECVI